jgi:hypothetical protein
LRVRAHEARAQRRLAAIQPAQPIEVKPCRESDHPSTACCPKFFDPPAQPVEAKPCENCDGEGTVSDASCGDIECCGAGDRRVPCMECQPAQPEGGEGK